MTAPIQYLDLPAVLRRLSCSKSTLYKLMQTTDFPVPVKLTTRSSRWPAHLVDEWMRRQCGETDRAA